MSETLSRKINDGLFDKKDDEIDLFDDIGEIIQLNYSSSGLAGMEYLLDQKTLMYLIIKGNVCGLPRELLNHFMRLFWTINH